MSDDENRLSPRTLAVIMLATALITGAWAATISTTTSPDAPATEGVSMTTNSGLTVQLGYDTKLTDGNHFPDNQTVILDNVTFESQSDGDTFIRLESQTSQWLNVTQGDLSQANVSVRGPGKQNVTIGGGIESLSINDSFDYSSSGSVDAVVDGRASGTLSFDSGRQAVVAINASSGETIDDGFVRADGTVHFDIPSGTHKIDFQSAPSTLRIYDETNPDQLIDKNAQLRIRYFSQDSDEVVERTVTDGTADLAGLPADERLIVTVAEAENNYTYRRAVVESLGTQQDIYLLPSGANTVETEFRVTDYSGNYPAGDTFLFVEKPIKKDFDADGTDETRYRTITGDTIGPTSTYPATLLKDNRYRIRIKNSPNQRVLGGYTATTTEVERVVIRNIDLEPPDGQSYAVVRNVTRDTSGQRQLTWKYLDESTDTTELNIQVRNHSSGDNIYEDHVESAVLQEYATYQIPLQNDTSYTVIWNATRDNETVSGRMPIGGGRSEVNIPLDPDWLGSAGLILIVFVSSLGGARKHSYIAIAVVGMAAILMFMAVVKILVPMWFLAALIAVGGHLREMQRPGE